MHRGRGVRGRLALVLAAAVSTAGATATAAPAATLGERPLAPLRAWGEQSARELAGSHVDSAVVRRRLTALHRLVVRTAPQLRRSSATVRSLEIARSSVALGEALDPLAGTLPGQVRDLFFITYQHHLERLGILARLDRTPTGRPLVRSGDGVAVSLTMRLRPDTDGDGTSDADELDDDGDGIVDGRDSSDQGWGIPDALQLREDLDDDVDEDGTPDAPADSLQGLLDLARGALLAAASPLSPLGTAGSGAYCVQVTERAPLLGSLGAARNLLSVARSRGCQRPGRVAAPKRVATPPGGLAARVTDATVTGRRLTADVRVARAARLDITVLQRVVGGTPEDVAFDERRSVRRGVALRQGDSVLSIPLTTDLAAGQATATVAIRPRSGGRVRRLQVPVTVPGRVRAGAPAAPPEGSAPVAAASVPAAVPPAAAGRRPGAPVRLLSATPQDPTHLVLTFDGPLGPGADDVANYRTEPDLFLSGAARLPGLTQVVLTTGPQYAVRYAVHVAGVTDTGGVPVDPGGDLASFTGPVALDADRPRVTSAGSTGNRTVLVQFSRPLGDSALDPSLFQIVRESAAVESGGVEVQEVRFRDPSRTLVELTTGAQSGIQYRVRVTGVVDITGQPLADRTGTTTTIDPTTAVFSGTPPSGGDADTDCDGVSDAQEGVGYHITVVRTDGTPASRDVTSDPGRPGVDCATPATADDTDGDGTPDSADTDRDGLTDDVERGLLTDPRDADTDDDGLTDDVEFNETYSDPTRQDSDGDSLTDGLEHTFFTTSSILADTDGDQITDDAEIVLGTRNARIADLPRPGLEIGSTNLTLDVRFTDVTGTESRAVDTKRVTSTLQQTESERFSTTDQRTVEAGTKLTTEAGFEVGTKAGFGADGSGAAFKASFKTTSEQSFSTQFVSGWTEESAKETQDTLEKSRESEVEQAQSANRTREVTGAKMQVAVNLKAASDIAFTIRHLQVSAFVQDPRDPTRLTPIATLIPVSEPDSGFNLGPLVPERGPIVFENTQVFPALVEDLMRDPRGLVFRFTNYDITDELGRNFAYTSQAINDRTAGLSIDYGGSDGDNDGVGDDTETRRIATGTGRLADTNEDGAVGPGDRRVVFDANGKQIGITLRDALAAMGLAEYDEKVTPTASLSQQAIDNSYSVIHRENGGDLIYRVRRTSVLNGDGRAWEIIGPNGIDHTLGLDDLILQAGQTYTLSFLQDADHDRVPAIVEFLNRCVDRDTDGDGDGLADSLDSDGDGLDDRFEIYVGWRVHTQQGDRQVRSRCASDDSDGDGRTDDDEAPGVIERDDDGLIVFTTGHEPRRVTTGTPDAMVGHELNDPITDPSSPDTDQDGLSDDFELDGYKVKLFGTQTYTDLLRTSPERFDHDGDTASDGVEQRIGGNPTVDDFRKFGDSDGDGLVNIVEETGWDVTVWRTSGGICESVCGDGDTIVTPGVVSDANDPDTDDDGIGDAEEWQRGLNPREPDTDSDRIGDFDEVRGFELRDLGTVTLDARKRDTDNDKRADGVEAGVATQGRIVVRVPGEEPYIADSDPRKPDTDLDRLVDGDEGRVGTDPNKANTDGDNRDDWGEVTMPGGGRRPLVPDLRVRIQLHSLFMDEDGTTGTTAGNFRFGFTGQRPDGTLTCQGACTLFDDPFNDMELNSDNDGPAPLDLRTCTDPEDEGPCRVDSARSEIQLDSDYGIYLRDPRVIDIGSVSTSEDQFEMFSVYGWLIEYEGSGGSRRPDCTARFPDPVQVDGTGAGTGTLLGTQLQQGITKVTLGRDIGCGISHERMKFELRTSVVAE